MPLLLAALVLQVQILGLLHPRELLGKNGIAPALHSASCGGRTALARTVFPAADDADQEASAEVRDPACAADRWTARIPEARLQAALHGEPLLATEPGRLLLARSLGWSTIPSPRFRSERRDGLVSLSGSGRGHGVGLCQEGAVRLATKGRSAHQILSRYFPNLVQGRLSHD